MITGIPILDFLIGDPLWMWQPANPSCENYGRGLVRVDSCDIHPGSHVSGAVGITTGLSGAAQATGSTGTGESEKAEVPERTTPRSRPSSDGLT